MAAIIYGTRAESFVNDRIGVMFRRLGGGVPPQHVQDAFYYDREGYRQSIPGGNVLLAETGTELLIQLGYRSLGPNYGFGSRVQLPHEVRVDELYFPKTTGELDTWEYGNIDQDDEQRRFVVRTGKELRQTYDVKTAQDLWKINLTLWPIREWEWRGVRYPTTAPVRSVTRSASTVAGIDKGVKADPQGNLKHGRILSADWSVRRDIEVRVLTSDAETVATPVPQRRSTAA